MTFFVMIYALYVNGQPPPPPSISKSVVQTLSGDGSQLCVDFYITGDGGTTELGAANFVIDFFTHP